MASITEQLYKLCAEYISGREAAIKKTIAEIQDAANNETKSSAGDKYETGREVMRQEMDLNQSRLNEVKKLKAALKLITPTEKGPIVLPGSVVYTNNGNFYISISAGQQKVGDTTFYAISAASPIGAKLVGRKAGDEFELNGKRFVVEGVG